MNWPMGKQLCITVSTVLWRRLLRDYSHVHINQSLMGSPCLPFGQFVKNSTVSVQFGFVAVKVPLFMCRTCNWSGRRIGYWQAWHCGPAFDLPPRWMSHVTSRPHTGTERAHAVQLTDNSQTLRPCVIWQYMMDVVSRHTLRRTLAIGTNSTGRCYPE